MGDVPTIAEDDGGLLGDQAINISRRYFKGLDGDRRILRQKNVLVSQFRDIGFKEAQFSECVFNHSTFERCYFRKAVFEQVSFLGCMFRDCRFDGAEFTECDLSWAEFQNCSITYEQVKRCLPKRENVLGDLARNLKVNAQSRGMSEDSRLFLKQELRASGKHYRNVAFDWRDPFFRNKYGWADRFWALLQWLRLAYSSFFWGHGEMPLRVIRSAFLLVVLFSFLNYVPAFPIQNMPKDANYLEHLAFSVANFITVQDGAIAPANLASRLLSMFEGALGLVFFGFLVASIYRRVSQR